MFRQMARHQTTRPPTPDEAARPWRVVSADGATTDFDPEATEKVDYQRAVSGMEMITALAPTPVGRNIAMPSAVPELSQWLQTGEAASAGDSFGWTRASATTSLGAVTVVDREDGQRASGPQPNRSGQMPREAPPTVGFVSGQAAHQGCREVDAQLARVIETWPNLPGNARTAVLALVEAAKDTF